MEEPPIKKVSAFTSNLLATLYREIFQNAPIGIYTINKDGLIDSFNPAMLKITGAKNVSDVFGLNALELPTYKEAGLAEFFRNGLSGSSFAVDIVLDPIHQTPVLYKEMVAFPDWRANCIGDILSAECMRV